MKVTGFGSITTNNVSKRRSTSATGSFADLLSSSEAGEASGAHAASDVAAMSGINNLVALQEISDEEVRRKKLVQRGNNLLDSLEELRRRLLIGTLPPHVVIELSKQISEQKQMVMDPRIMEVIEDIELRAAVELAKLEMAINPRF